MPQKGLDNSRVGAGAGCGRGLRVSSCGAGRKRPLSAPGFRGWAACPLGWPAAADDDQVSHCPPARSGSAARPASARPTGSTGRSRSRRSPRPPDIADRKAHIADEHPGAARESPSPGCSDRACTPPLNGYPSTKPVSGDGRSGSAPPRLCTFSQTREHTIALGFGEEGEIAVRSPGTVFWTPGEDPSQTQAVTA
jgi:hypothetical protein